MVANSKTRILGGLGTLLGPPPDAQFRKVVEFLKIHLPKFAERVLEDQICLENSLNERLSIFITNAAVRENFFANREKIEDETRGDSPAVDIGIFLKIEDIGANPPLITVFEGKRLSTELPKRRWREYVIGHEKKGKQRHCGGIERFKLAIHGRNLDHAGMIGYLQDGTPDDWHEKINSWICDLNGGSFEPEWSETEQLAFQYSDKSIAEYSSTVNRSSSKLSLTHLWIDLVATTG